jgi:acetylornithine deacetylase/succinyl-diaminopimelate desuccinylase-like protein
MGPVSERGPDEEAIEVLQRLIRFNTVNPPGAEREASDYLRSHLEQAGFECEQLAAEPERPNLIARLRGEGHGPTLGYLGHVDTVLASPEDWSRDPWSGELADGAVWGRGALDMKGQVAAEVTAAARLARSGWRPKRGELLVMCVADEEAGGSLGAQFLCREHPDKVRCDYLVNEGAGVVLPFEGRRLFGVCCAEKGVFRFTVTAEGAAGHASMPRLGDNALLKLAPLIERMREQPSFDLTDEPRALLDAVGQPADGEPAAALESLRERDPALAFIVEPMLGVTLAPTRVRASEKINVIPARAEVQVDCRVPPGLGEEQARARAREVLGADGYRLEFDECVIGNRSPMDTPLMDAVRDWIGEQDPEATVVPTVLPGFSDSRTWRATFPDCVAYGFFPQRHMTLYEAAPLIHSADERLDARDLAWATEFYGWLARRLLG